MKFDTPATSNPIDQLKVVGNPVDRIDGPLKTTGTAHYANDRHDVAANQALIAAFDPMLRRSERAEIVAVTSSVGRQPRAFWGAYGSSKAALETLALSYADETAHSGRIRVHVVDPGATRTRMRELAFPGEEPEEVKPPQVVADFILERLLSDAPTGELVRVDG